jgi:dCTP deaminase
MGLITRSEILESLSSNNPNSLFIDPLLDDGQIGNVTVDLRLGYDFLVSILTRKPSIDIGVTENIPHRAIGSYFQETRREIGEKFVVYPNQVVLATTIEYVSLPLEIYGDVISRSSYTRLGLPINTMIQPGFRGCVPIELFNHGNSPVELVVGCRICQIRFFKIENNKPYLQEGNPRKYFGNTRPTVSAADYDPELIKLNKLPKS